MWLDKCGLDGFPLWKGRMSEDWCLSERHEKCIAHSLSERHEKCIAHSLSERHEKCIAHSLSERHEKCIAHSLSEGLRSMLPK